MAMAVLYAIGYVVCSLFFCVPVVEFCLVMWYAIIVLWVRESWGKGEST